MNPAICCVLPLFKYSWDDIIAVQFSHIIAKTWPTRHTIFGHAARWFTSYHVSSAHHGILPLVRSDILRIAGCRWFLHVFDSCWLRRGPGGLGASSWNGSCSWSDTSGVTQDLWWWWWWWWWLMVDDWWWWWWLMMMMMMVLVMVDDDWWWLMMMVMVMRMVMMMMVMMVDDDGDDDEDGDGDDWWWLMMIDDDWWWLMMMIDDDGEDDDDEMVDCWWLMMIWWW